MRTHGTFGCLDLGAALGAAVSAVVVAQLWASRTDAQADVPATPAIVVTVGGKDLVVEPQPGATSVEIDIDLATGEIFRARWMRGGEEIGNVRLPDGTTVNRGAGATGLKSSTKPPASANGVCVEPQLGATSIEIDIDLTTGEVFRARWMRAGEEIGNVRLPDGRILKRGAGGTGVSWTGCPVEISVGAPNLPYQIAIPGVAGDSGSCDVGSFPEGCTPDPPAEPPQAPPKAPVLKTLGCASSAKVNQLIACQSDGVPGDANSPVTLLEWHAPGGIPDVGFDGIVFLTKFPEPGVKQISLKACSGDACTTLSQTVTVSADVPPGPQPLTGSGTFTLFEQSGQCEGLTIAEILQLSLSLTPNGTAVAVAVTNKGWAAQGTWNDQSVGKLLSVGSAALPSPPAGVTAYFFSIAADYNSATKVLAGHAGSGFTLHYDRPGGGRCTTRYNFNIQLN